MSGHQSGSKSCGDGWRKVVHLMTSSSVQGFISHNPDHPNLLHVIFYSIRESVWIKEWIKLWWEEEIHNFHMIYALCDFNLNFPWWIWCCVGNLVLLVLQEGVENNINFKIMHICCSTHKRKAESRSWVTAVRIQSSRGCAFRATRTRLLFFFLSSQKGQYLFRMINYTSFVMVITLKKCRRGSGCGWASTWISVSGNEGISSPANLNNPNIRCLVRNHTRAITAYYSYLTF